MVLIRLGIVLALVVCGWKQTSGYVLAAIVLLSLQNEAIAGIVRGLRENLYQAVDRMQESTAAIDGAATMLRKVVAVQAAGMLSTPDKHETRH